MLVCPHAVIRSKVYEPSFLRSAPPSFKTHPARLPEWKGLNYTLQVSTEDCTGCAICVDVCPARNKSETRLKAINMRPQIDLREAERQNWDFFSALPNRERPHLSFENVRGMQVAEPLFEFSGACAGCGETPYIKLLTQLFGDRLLIANATGCSSIYGGNLPTTPYAAGADGLGPAWSNSLFEDAAEFGIKFAKPDIDVAKLHAKSDKIVFCAAVDRNGYLPVHNKVYSHPQRPGDVAWNTAHSRNRRIFNDTAGLAAGRNQRTYLIQSYARDMGNGITIMMREIDVPIRVRGRHWGGFRTAYKL